MRGGQGVTETNEELREALRKTKRETLLALEEWDTDKAAALIRTAQIIEKKLEPGNRSTLETIRRAKENVMSIS